MYRKKRWERDSWGGGLKNGFLLNPFTSLENISNTDSTGLFRAFILVSQQNKIIICKLFSYHLLNIFAPKWHLLRSLPVRVQKQFKFSEPTPSNGPRNRCCPHQNHSVLCYLNQCCGSLTFWVDPDPRIHAFAKWIRILLFSSLVFKMPVKNFFF